MPKAYSNINPSVVQRMWETKHELDFVRTQINKLTSWNGTDTEEVFEVVDDIHRLQKLEQELVSYRMTIRPWNYAYV